MSTSPETFGGLAQKVSLTRVAQMGRRALYRSALYHRLLCWQPRTGIRQSLPLRRPANATVGRAVLDGFLPLAGRRLPFGAHPWSVPPPGPAASAAMHDFAWLVDLKDLATAAARTRAQELVRGWIRANAHWNEQAWQPGLLGRRLLAWLACAEFVLSDEDTAARAAFWRSLSMQARHLSRVSRHEHGSAAAFAAIVGRMAAAHCLAIGSLTAASGLLEREIEAQILADGCHVQRCPSIHLIVLRDLLDIRAILADAQEDIPSSLSGAIERMVAMLRFFCHGDGRLALFNGGKEEDVHIIDTVLAEAGVKDRPRARAYAGGFERIRAEPVLLIVDAGGPPPPGADRQAHAAPGAFELSLGRERLIVNCGGFTGDDARWRAAMRSTAAHSAAMIDTVNAVPFDAHGGLHARRVDVGAVRRGTDAAAWLEVEHTGYGARLATLSRRRFYLDAMGEDLRGEDVCESRGGGHGGGRLIVRFHLHPDVQASFGNGVACPNGVILLALPSGAIFRFISVGGSIALEDSVYLGSSDVPRPTRQIVVRADLAGEATRLKWALRRVDSEQEAAAAQDAPEPAAPAPDE